MLSRQGIRKAGIPPAFLPNSGAGCNLACQSRPCHSAWIPLRMVAYDAPRQCNSKFPAYLLACPGSGMEVASCVFVKLSGLDWPAPPVEPLATPIGGLGGMAASDGGIAAGAVATGF